MARMLADKMDAEGVTLPVREVSLSTPLRKIAYQMVGWQYSDSEETDGGYERFKEKWFSEFDRTGRELMIDVSERFLKPVYGEQVMADLLIGELSGFHGVALIRDCGFQIEANHLSKLLGFRKLYVARVRRDGCDFSNDSREWVEHPFSADYPNNGSLDDLRTEAGRLYGRLVNQQGWVL
jgi:hypothetical protein